MFKTLLIAFIQIILKNQNILMLYFLFHRPLLKTIYINRGQFLDLFDYF